MNEHAHMKRPSGLFIVTVYPLFTFEHLFGIISVEPIREIPA